MENSFIFKNRVIEGIGVSEKCIFLSHKNKKQPILQLSVEEYEEVLYWLEFKDFSKSFEGLVNYLKLNITKQI
jgi:hypothetical protein